MVKKIIKKILLYSLVICISYAISVNMIEKEVVKIENISAK